MNINECPSISSSDSESDVEGDSVIQSAFSGTELTLQDDDESPLLMQQRPEDEDEEEDEQGMQELLLLLHLMSCVVYI